MVDQGTAHPLRRIRDLMETHPKNYSNLPAIHDLLSAGMHVSQTRIEILPSAYIRQVREQLISSDERVRNQLTDL